MDTDEKLEVTRVIKEMHITVTRNDGQDLSDREAAKFANLRAIESGWTFQEVMRVAYNQIVVIYERD